MSAETNPIPDWAAHEQAQDMARIDENFSRFWQMAVMGAKLMGRGAIVVDFVARPRQNGHLFTYFSEEQVAWFEDEDINCLVAEYEPDKEFVVVLLKPEQRTSSYRVQGQSHQP